MIKISRPTIGLFQASGLTVYIAFVAKFMQSVSEWFKPISPELGITLFLITFVLSAVVSGLLILGYPLILFFDNKRKMALEIIVWSAIWLGGFLIAFISLFLPIR